MKAQKQQASRNTAQALVRILEKLGVETVFGIPGAKIDSVEGTLLGFFTPTYARTINVPGYHLHLLTEDRKHGGHVLEVRAARLQASLHLTSDLHLVLPENEEFLKANLTQDPAAALAKAEGASSAKS